VTVSEITGTVIIVELLGLGPALFGPGASAASADDNPFAPAPQQAVVQTDLHALALQAVMASGLEMGGQTVGIAGARLALLFQGEDCAAQALNGAIRIIDRFRSPDLSGSKVSLRLALDQGALSLIQSESQAGFPLVSGLPMAVASDLVLKARAATAFLTQKVADAAGEGFCFDESSRLRLPDYPEKIVTMALCGRC